MASIRFYADHNVHSAVVAARQRLAVDVTTAKDDGMSDAPDISLMNRAADRDRVLVTNDRDFQGIAADWQRQGRPFPGVLIIRRQMGEIRALVDDLAYIADVAEPADLRDSVLYIPL